MSQDLVDDVLVLDTRDDSEHGYEIPFPQREVRVLNEAFAVNRAGDA